MKNKTSIISAIPLWTRICVLGLFSLFLLITVALPVIEFQSLEISIVENIGGSENETEEVDEFEDYPAYELLLTLDYKNTPLKNSSSSVLNELHHNLLTPPPELN